MENRNTGSPASAHVWPWLNTSLTSDVRATLLLAQSTLEEKVALVHGEFPAPYGFYSPPIARLDQVPAVLESWYGGQEQGNALAAGLFGDVNPSGKLPVTFPRSERDTPVSSPEQNAGGGDFVTSYSEGLAVGYRGYDQFGIEPLFPFGYGLSYTSFMYSKLQVEPATSDGAKALRVSFAITNTGSRAGAEVAQVYLGLPVGTGEPPKRLVGWTKVELEPGENKEINVTVDPNAASHPLSCWNVKTNAWEIASGDYQLFVGASSRDISLTAILRVHQAE